MFNKENKKRTKAFYEGLIEANEKSVAALKVISDAGQTEEHTEMIGEIVKYFDNQTTAFKNIVKGLK